MKSSLMLVCAMVAAMGMSALAEEQANANAAGGQAQAQEAKKHGQMTAAQREERINKRLEAIKAKDEALYKELIALREKDPEAFKAKMRELGKAQGQAHGEGKGKVKKAANKKEKAE